MLISIKWLLGSESKMTDRLSKLKRRQLDETARRFPRGAASPRSGWVRTMREALGMSQAQLAARAGISRATVQKLELAEGRRRITLDSLDRLAAALGCQVAIALVPLGGSLEGLREQAANAKAQALLRSAVHSMNLEDQIVSPKNQQAVKQDLVESLLSGSPRKLWR
jgi:predicted DNA-binding mobile mystery protein A